MTGTGFSLRRADGPQRFARLLLRIGPLAVKVGQHLALRPDLLPQEYCDTLLDLTDHASPFAWEQVDAILETDLGAPVGNLFTWISTVPFAAGSMAQVHRAKTFGGTDVAVKVRRPDLERSVSRDMRRFRVMVALMRRIDLPLPVDAAEIVKEVESWLRQELDFQREADNARRLRSLVGDSAAQEIPRVHDRLSGCRVVTYDFLEGVPLTQVLKRNSRLGRQYPTPAEGSAAPGTDTRTNQPDEALLDKFFRNLVESCLSQMFHHHFFHADLHPGNLLVLAHGRVGFLDFGLCDSLDPTVRGNQIRYLAALHDDNQPGMFQALQDILVSTKDSDAAGLARDFDAQFRLMAGQSGPPTSSNLIGVINAARRNHFQIPPRVLALSRALMTLERLAVALDRLDVLQDVGRSFFVALRKADFLATLCEREGLLRLATAAVDLTRDGPTQVARLMADLSDGNLRLKVEVEDSPRMIAIANRRARLWAATLLSICMALLLTIPNPPALFGYSLGWVLGAALLVLLATCAFLWRRLQP